MRSLLVGQAEPRHVAESSRAVRAHGFAVVVAMLAIATGIIVWVFSRRRRD